MEDSRLYAIALTMTPGIGAVLAKTLISYCGSPQAVFETKRTALVKIPGIGPNLARVILNNKLFHEAEKELTFVEKKEITVLQYFEKQYPKRLLQVDDSPILLYYKGSETLNHTRTVAIVGTRTPSERGIINCENLVKDLMPYNVQIISGLAYGIDSTAHNSSISNNIPTIGIPGHGLDRIYPSKNKALVKKMIENGGILSQFPSGTKPDREHFPMRNKIIAAMADVIIVVESKRKGGSIITAIFANDYYKDVFAIPGRLSDDNSEGCNKLIKEHKANLLESAKDISYIMRWEELDKEKSVQSSLFIELDEEEKKLIDIIRKNENSGIDFLSYETKLQGSQLAALLLNLEFKGLLKCLPGKKYVLR